MDCLKDFEKQLRYAYRICEDIIMDYPVFFREEALELLKEYDVFVPDTNKEYMSFLLPFWLGRYYSIEDEILIKLCTGNIFGLFYFLQLDNVMDNEEGKNNGSELSLANMFFMDFLAQYQSIFPHDSVFWKYFRKYFRQWSVSSKLHEEGLWMKEQSHDSLDYLAHKASPQKVSVAAVCVLKDAGHMIDSICLGVDKIALSVQVMDDWYDWREDVDSGNCTYFLSLIMKKFGLKNIKQIDTIHYMAAIHRHGIFMDFCNIARGNHQFVEKTSIEYMIQYHNKLLDVYEGILENIKKEEKVMLYGGFGRILDKNC